MPLLDRFYFKNYTLIMCNVCYSSFLGNDPDWDAQLLVQSIEDVYILPEVVLIEEGVKLSSNERYENGELVDCGISICLH